MADRITYSLTPALSLYGVVHTFLTAQAVDTDTSSRLANTGGTVSRLTVSEKSWVSGDSNYLGTELNLGLTWYFSANAAFDLVGGYLFAGSALDASECRGTLSAAGVCAGQVVKMDAQDAYTLAARIRLAF